MLLTLCFWIVSFHLSSLFSLVLPYLLPSLHFLMRLLQPCSLLICVCSFLTSLYRSLCLLFLFMDFFICGQWRMVRFRLDISGIGNLKCFSGNIHSLAVILRSRGRVFNAWNQWDHCVPLCDNLLVTSLCSSLAQKLSLSQNWTWFFFLLHFFFF